MDQKLQDFIKQYNGRAVDFDGAYGAQCVDLMNRFLVDVCGIASPISVFPGATAFEIYQNANDSRFDKIANTPDGVPSAGDIIFWNTSIGSAGHVAIFIKGDSSSFTSLDQNWPVGSSVHEQSHDYNGVAGWLHLKNIQGSVQVDSATFQNLVNKSTKYDEFVKLGYNSAEDVTSKVNSQQATIDSLNKQIGDLTNEKNGYQSDIQTLQGQIKDLADQVSKIKDEDITLSSETIAAQHERDDYKSQLNGLYKALNVQDVQAAEAEIKTLQTKPEEVTAHAQPVIEGLAKAALPEPVKPLIVPKPIKPVVQPKVNAFQRFFQWFNS